MIRVAAIGDTHFAEDTRGRLRPHWDRLADEADVFLLCGDLTNLGNEAQARALADELRGLSIPMVAVLGNHDYHAGDPAAVRRILEGVSVRVLDGDSTTFEIEGRTLGIAGVKGFGGGFTGACGHMFGEAEMKVFMQVTEREALMLENSLRALHTDFRVAMLHYSPVKDTLAGERLEIYPFLGSYRLAEALDAAGADLAIHGHSHHGAEKGVTARGIPVRNVAMPLVRRAYVVYDLDHAHDGAAAHRFSMEGHAP
jgi:Icc-related predicted phosphoesterase